MFHYPDHWAPWVGLSWTNSVNLFKRVLFPVRTLSFSFFFRTRWALPSFLFGLQPLRPLNKSLSLISSQSLLALWPHSKSAYNVLHVGNTQVNRNEHSASLSKLANCQRTQRVSPRQTYKCQMPTDPGSFKKYKLPWESAMDLNLPGSRTPLVKMFTSFSLPNIWALFRCLEDLLHYKP